MKHSLFWAAVEAAAKATRSGLSVVGALVDCGIPRQQGAQWLTEFEEENECLEAPLSADFTDEPEPRIVERLTADERGRVWIDTKDRSWNFDDSRYAWICTWPDGSHEMPFSEGIMRQYPGGFGEPFVEAPQNSRTNAGATSSRAVEEGLTEGARPPAAPSVSVLNTIKDVLAEHYLETYSDRKIVGCRCGLEVGSRQQHWDHQADLISGALRTRAQAAEK